eukprot:7387440-Prymnesium_polylepis.1
MAGALDAQILLQGPPSLVHAALLCLLRPCHRQQLAAAACGAAARRPDDLDSADGWRAVPPAHLAQGAHSRADLAGAHARKRAGLGVAAAGSCEKAEGRDAATSSSSGAPTAAARWAARSLQLHR